MSIVYEIPKVSKYLIYWLRYCGYPTHNFSHVSATSDEGEMIDFQSIRARVSRMPVVGLVRLKRRLGVEVTPFYSIQLLTWDRSDLSLGDTDTARQRKCCYCLSICEIWYKSRPRLIGRLSDVCARRRLSCMGTYRRMRTAEIKFVILAPMETWGRCIAQASK